MDIHSLIEVANALLAIKVGNTEGDGGVEVELTILRGVL